MKLQQIGIIDLGSSVIDEKRSNPKKGDYVFISKKYVTTRGPGSRSKWHFTWERYSPVNAYREIEEAKTHGYSFVESGIDPYIPESVLPNASGYFVFGDLVLMKCPLLTELERRIENIELSKGAGKATLESFKAQVRSEGGEITDEVLGLLGT